MDKPEVPLASHEKTLETWYRQVRYEHALYNMAGELCRKRYFFLNFLPTIIIAGLTTILSTGIKLEDFAYKDMTIAVLSVLSGICAGTSHYWNWQGEAVRHTTTAQAWSQMSEKLQRFVQEWRDGRLAWCELHSSVLKCIGEIKRDSIEISGSTRSRYHHEIEEAAKRYEIPRPEPGSKWCSPGPRTVLSENGAFVSTFKGNIPCIADADMIEVLPHNPVDPHGAAPSGAASVHRPPPPPPARHTATPPIGPPEAHSASSDQGEALLANGDGRASPAPGADSSSQSKEVSPTEFVTADYFAYMKGRVQ